MGENLFSIEIADVFWISEDDEGEDLCAHGSIKVLIGDHLVIKPYDDWYNVSPRPTTPPKFQEIVPVICCKDSQR